MTDQKKPEAIADDDLDAAAGGAKHEFRERVSFSYGPSHGSEEEGRPDTGLSSFEAAAPGADGKTIIRVDTNDRDA